MQIVLELAIGSNKYADIYAGQQHHQSNSGTCTAHVCLLRASLHHGRTGMCNDQLTDVLFQPPDVLPSQLGLNAHSEYASEAGVYRPGLYGRVYRQGLYGEGPSNDLIKDALTAFALVQRIFAPYRT